MAPHIRLRRNWHADSHSDLDWPQLLRMGLGVLHLQLSHPAPGFSVVGQIYHDHVSGTRFGLSICVSGRLLRLHLPRLDGWVSVVGYRGLQKGKYIYLFHVRPSQRSVADVCGRRAATGKRVRTNAWRLANISEDHDYRKLFLHMARNNNALHSFVVQFISLRVIANPSSPTRFQPSRRYPTMPEAASALTTT